MTKQDEIPRMEKPGTCHGYYLFVEDNAGCLIEQRDKEGNIQLVKDTDTDCVLPTDYITEAEAETNQIPEKGQQTIEDNSEAIRSTSMANYDQEEVETSLLTIANSFHTIRQEYEYLVGIVPHMSKVQVVNMVAQMPILPFLKQEMKMEIKQGKTIDKTMEPVPSISHERPETPADTGTAQAP